MVSIIIGTAAAEIKDQRISEAAKSHCRKNTAVCRKFNHEACKTCGDRTVFAACPTDALTLARTMRRFRSIWAAVSSAPNARPPAKTGPSVSPNDFRLAARDRRDLIVTGNELDTGQTA